MQPFEFLAAPPAAAASLTSQQQQQLASNNNDSLPETESSYKAFPEDAENGNHKPLGEAGAAVAATTSEERDKEVVQGIYIALFAIFGTLMRMIVAQLFGEYCSNPESIGWLAASAPLCITGSGGTTEQGGIIFADLPANMLGSFVMGVFQNGAALGVAMPMAIAWLKPYDAFQDMPILHKAITTGFCGSLTTFSGWNSAMVVLLFGTGDNRPTHIFNAVFGYIIGMETAIGSFVLGKSIARKFHQIVNPILAAEAEAAKERQAEGVYLNRDLPDFERRYLPDLDMGSKGEKNYGEFLPLGRLDGLESWRRTTKDARRVNHPQLDLLKRIEQTVLVDGLPIPPDTVTYARSYGWDLDALDNWVASKRGLASRLPSLTSQSMIAMPEESRWLQPTFASALLGVVIMSLLLLLVMLNGKRAYTITNRTMVYAMLWAPAGALLRWKLSALNGKLKVDGWTWFPLGTFLANLLGSIVSIIAIAGEYDMGSVYDRTFFWDVGSIRAVKVGFAGSLTTVSTFVAEINGFMRKSDHAYPYILSTIASCSIVASIIYGSMLLLWKN